MAEGIGLVGGPLDGQCVTRRPSSKVWPPKVYGCYTECLRTGQFGLYRLKDGNLVWCPLVGTERFKKARARTLAR